ncbi:ribbon-helix-helix domain-containing protein, partial [Acidiplasma aeolicum]
IFVHTKEKNIYYYNLILLMRDKTEKLTLRISKEELEEIDSFLSTNSNYTNRSEFIRLAVLEYISNLRIGIISKNNTLHVNPIIEKSLQRAVSSGYFKSLDDAYEEIINEAWRNNIISGLIEAKHKEIEKIEKTLEGEKKYDEL